MKQYGVSILITTKDVNDLQNLANILTVFRDQSRTVGEILLSPACEIKPIAAEIANALPPNT